MKISSAVIVKNTGSDKVVMTTDLPNPNWPCNGTQTIHMDVAYDMAESYMQTHFPDVPFTVVDRQSRPPLKANLTTVLSNDVEKPIRPKGQLRQR